MRRGWHTNYVTLKIIQDFENFLTWSVTKAGGNFSIEVLRNKWMLANMNLNIKNIAKYKKGIFCSKISMIWQRLEIQIKNRHMQGNIISNTILSLILNTLIFSMLDFVMRFCWNFHKNVSNFVKMGISCGSIVLS